MILGQDYEYEMLRGKSYMKYIFLSKSYRLRYEYIKTANYKELKKGERDG